MMLVIYQRHWGWMFLESGLSTLRSPLIKLGCVFMVDGPLKISSAPRSRRNLELFQTHAWHMRQPYLRFSLKCRICDCICVLEINASMPTVSTNLRFNKLEHLTDIACCWPGHRQYYIHLLCFESVSCTICDVDSPLESKNRHDATAPEA